MESAAVVDTNILVYRFDPRHPLEQSISEQLLRQGLIERQRLVIPHQAIIEFVAAVIRPVNGLDGRSLLSRPDALTEAESLMSQFEVVYPNDLVLRTALRGVQAYRMAWFDAHLWAYAETMGIRELISEDFSHGQVYGQVRIRNPFVEADKVMQLPPLYSDDGPGR